MAKFSITQLEQATVVPAGSLHLVEMGDGSGTKAVTQEVLEEKIGEALKIGDLAQLQTENKESIVAAINEAAQSGGGGATVDILDSKEEIEANTETGKAAGALAVQEMFTELNDNLKFPDGVKFYPDVQNGVRGYNTDPQRGADTFCPFKVSTALYLGNVTWSHYTGKTNTYDFTKKIADAGLDPSAYTDDNIFFRPISTSAQKSGSTSTMNETWSRSYTYTNGVIKTISQYEGGLPIMDVTSSCYLVI